jgi:hypothetical protein
VTLLSKIIITLCTIITAITPFVVKWYLKRKKNTIDSLFAHPVFALINKTKCDANNKILRIEGEKKDVMRDYIFTLFISANMNEWDKFLRGLIKNEHFHNS